MMLAPISSPVIPPRVSKRVLASDVSLDGRKITSAFWGPPASKRFKLVKMCPRKDCGLEPQHCQCCCEDCGALLRGLKRCKRKGCTFGANRSPEVTTPPQESPPRARLPSKPPPSLSPPPIALIIGRNFSRAPAMGADPGRAQDASVTDAATARAGSRGAAAAAAAAATKAAATASLNACFKRGVNLFFSLATAVAAAPLPHPSRSSCC